MGKESSLTGIYFVSKLYTLSPACATSDTVVKDAQNIPRGPCTDRTINDCRKKLSQHSSHEYTDFSILLLGL